jgi:hypothetical protein
MIARFFRKFTDADLLTLTDMEDIRSMHPRRFEWFCKFFLPYLGYQSIFVTRKHGSHDADGGVDLLATLAGLKVLIQCKRWNEGQKHFIPVDVIRALGGCMLREHIPRGAVVATRRFSSLDYQEAKKMDIELIGTSEIVRTMNRINPRFLGR